ncbi:E3 ubiquitin-protein like [Actinidia chinensis var. chinensis]|uniref:E3 ubiquitin-protein like n=1 Tax=Actinidia chinensis var. chinensis TaxID=1590841 RepID=A0A2R6RHN0_ACTCC|nr:E3 ubiquitin-protein like [Actinidia chinensis var. chinensis]
MMAIQAQLYPDSFVFPLGRTQNWMENAYGFNESCFNLPQKQQQLQNLQQKTQILCFDNQSSMAFSESVSALIEKQWQEIDRFICLQNERLRLALQEQKRQQIAMILSKYEEKTMFLLKHKEEEIVKAMNRTMELEDFLRRMEIESQTWQRLAKENEAMVSSLNNTIEKLRENGCFANGVEDAESCCDLIDRGERTGENRGEREAMVCKCCNSRGSCVIFLPCRHLCSCKDCQFSLDSCPVCGMAKKAIIEALV